VHALVRTRALTFALRSARCAPCVGLSDARTLARPRAHTCTDPSIAAGGVARHTVHAMMASVVESPAVSFALAAPVSKAPMTTQIVLQANHNKSTPLSRMFGLRYAADVRTLILTASYFALFLYMWLRSSWIIGDGIYSLRFLAHIPLWIALCNLSFVGAVATHNCIHCPMFLNRTSNRGTLQGGHARMETERAT
jgi:hypothetical protein